MNKKEFSIIAVAIKAAYPHAKVLDTQAAMDLWYRMLSDLPYKTCETAMFELFTTHSFPPSISEIRERCTRYTAPQLKDEGEAWEEVIRAIKRYGVYRAEEALDSMSPAVRKTVERIGYRDICLDENETATRAHFFRIYSAIAERERMDAQIPIGVLEERKMLMEMAERDRLKLEDKPAREQPMKLAEPDRVKADPEAIERMIREFRERTHR